MLRILLCFVAIVSLVTSARNEIEYIELLSSDCSECGMGVFGNVGMKVLYQKGSFSEVPF